MRQHTGIGGIVKGFITITDYKTGEEFIVNKNMIGIVRDTTKDDSSGLGFTYILSQNMFTIGTVKETKQEIRDKIKEATVDDFIIVTEAGTDEEIILFLSAIGAIRNANRNGEVCAYIATKNVPQLMHIITKETWQEILEKIKEATNVQS